MVFVKRIYHISLFLRYSKEKTPTEPHLVAFAVLELPQLSHRIPLKYKFDLNLTQILPVVVFVLNGKFTVSIFNILKKKTNFKLRDSQHMTSKHFSSLVCHIILVFLVFSLYLFLLYFFPFVVSVKSEKKLIIQFLYI